jgi:hypothetical protein
VQRLPSLHSPAPMAACRLVVAGLVLGSGRAEAQVTGSFSDPLTPSLTSDPAEPPRFEKTDSRSLAQADQPTTFAPASGAGKPKPKTQSSTQPIATGTAAAQVRSPFQQPISPLSGEPLAAAPGDPNAAAAGTPAGGARSHLQAEDATRPV